VKLRIRPLREAEQETARQIVLDGLREHFGHVDGSYNRDLEDIEASYLAAGHPFLVAEADSMLVGTGALVIETEDRGRIVRVSVARACRRQGVGCALVTRLMSIARENGLARLWAETNDDWVEAIGLYLHCGFQEFARDAGSVYLELDLACNPDGPAAY
jgi:N-acetylglutamate synthase-like GNAT family acetyltransferase